jgi:hypothetical protein
MPGSREMFEGEIGQEPPEPMPTPEQVEKVRRAIFNALSGEAEVNTGMILAAVYEAMGYPGIDYPPPSISTTN